MPSLPSEIHQDMNQPPRFARNSVAGQITMKQPIMNPLQGVEDIINSSTSMLDNSIDGRRRNIQEPSTAQQLNRKKIDLTDSNPDQIYQSVSVSNASRQSNFFSNRTNNTASKVNKYSSPAIIATAKHPSSSNEMNRPY